MDHIKVHHYNRNGYREEEIQMFTFTVNHGTATIYRDGEAYGTFFIDTLSMMVRLLVLKEDKDEEEIALVAVLTEAHQALAARAEARWLSGVTSI